MKKPTGANRNAGFIKCKVYKLLNSSIDSENKCTNPAAKNIPAAKELNKPNTIYTKLANDVKIS